MTPNALLIIDFEATCDSHGRLPTAEMEIIEIGAVLLNADDQVAGQFQCFVKPVLNPVLTPFCTALTGIEQHDVDSADPFPTAAHALSDWLRLDVPVSPARWVSWGDYDRKQLNRDCERHQLANPLPLLHRNVKTAFASVHGGQGWALSNAVAHADLAFEGTLHRGLDDALNISRLLQNNAALKTALEG